MIVECLDWAHFTQMCRAHHLLELSRVLLKPVLDNLGPMALCNILLEYPIIVGVHEVHEELQMVTKQ